MESITGIEINNPEICIKDKGSTFACVCPKCIKEGFEKMDELLNSLTPRCKNNKMKIDIINITGQWQVVFGCEGYYFTLEYCEDKETAKVMAERLKVCLGKYKNKLLKCQKN